MLIIRIILQIIVTLLIHYIMNQEANHRVPLRFIIPYPATERNRVSMSFRLQIYDCLMKQKQEPIDKWRTVYDNEVGTAVFALLRFAFAYIIIRKKEP